jgi:hypothetical protein
MPTGYAPWGAARLQARLQAAGKAPPAGKPGQMLLSRLFRRRRPTAVPTPAPVPDRSALLAELEVSVPAPERLVRWDTALNARAQRLSRT